MRQTLPEGYTHDEGIPHPVTFRNPDGNVLELYVVASNVIRVRHLTANSNNNNNVDRPRVSVDVPPTIQQDQPLFSINTTTSSKESKYVQVETPDIRVNVELPYLRLVWHDKKDGTTFAEDLPRRAYAYGGGKIYHYRKRISGDKYYGLGERTGNLNLAGRRFRLERLDSMGYDAENQDPLYKFSPFYLTLSHDGARAHGVFYTSMSLSTFDFGQELDAMWGPYTMYEAETQGPLEYVVMYGPSVPSVVRTFSLLTGAPRHLPPRFGFGYLASSMAYAEVDNAQERIEQFVADCRKHDIPCDGMHLSSGYTVMPDSGDRCVFTWNRERFPDPEGMAQRLREQGVHVFANIKPWLLHDSHPDFPAVRDSKGLVWQHDGKGPSEVWQWRAGRHTMGKASYIDFTSQAGYSYWQQQVRTKLIDKGYHLWLDNNEFAMLDDNDTYACEVKPDGYHNLVVNEATTTSSREAGTPLQTLLMAQASYNALREARPTERPFLITRSAVPYCQQLVTQTWSGDNNTEWKTIGYNVSMGAGAALCAVPTGYGHDVGGFSGPKPDPELFVRWVQQGILWPRFCIHSYNTDDTVTEPWMYDETLPTIREAMQLRYRLIPYLYSLHVIHCYRACQPMVRPVFYDFQDDPKTHEQQFEFMLGPDLLVVPMIESGTTTRTVYLPSGASWYHYQSGRYCEGGQMVSVDSTLEDAACPFFVKAGSMLAFGKVMNHVHALPDNERRVQIFPERTTTGERRTFTLIEDDGKTLYHEQGGAFAEVRLWMEATESIIRVGLEILHDGYFPDYDTVWVTCPIQSETRQLVFVDPQFSGQEYQPKDLERIVDDTTLHCYYGIPVPWNRQAQK